MLHLLTVSMANNMKLIKYYAFGLLMLAMLSRIGLAQPAQRPLVLAARVLDGDTLLQAQLPILTIYGTRSFKSLWEQRRYEKLVRNVRKVYPYARLAGAKLREYEIVLTKAHSERERKQLMKKAEKELNSRFGPELKKLTFSQGKILIKLIDRETGNTSYTLLQDLRGRFTAFVWQQFARIFGYNLKVKYNPQGEDRQIEEIVQRIEEGGF